MTQKVEVNGRTVEIKTNEIGASRNGAEYRKKIFKWLARIGIMEDFISIEYSTYGHEQPFAEVKWMVNGKEHIYRCTSQKNATSCLAAVQQLVHQEVIFIERGIKTFTQVMNQFLIEGPMNANDPYMILRISPDQAKDIEYLTYKYKRKAKELHPDTGGDPEKFKQLQEAYETLKEQADQKH